MYLKTGKVNECCGCSACVAACPKSCITMKMDTEGFKFPEITDMNACINCGKCEKVCPFAKENIHSSITTPQCYYGWRKEPEQRMNSTSGGAFAAITEVCFSNGYSSVYGVSYDKDLLAHHECISCTGDVKKLLRSKYMQSDIGNTYKEINDKIKNAEKVVFSGTPCQVQGLINYVNPKYREYLLTIALVCHGVGSPLVFRRYLNEIEKKHKCRISEVIFRDKRTINGMLTHKCTTIKYTDGTETVSVEDPYTMAFGTGLINRESCFHCPYTTPLRNADITIGDFWGIEKVDNTLTKDVSKGISLILTHSPFGEEVVQKLSEKMQIENVDLSFAINPRQQQLIRPMDKHPHRDTFMKHISKGGKFTTNAKLELISFKFKRSINVRLSRFRTSLRRH